MNINKFAMAATCAFASTLPAHADVLGVYVGVQSWETQATGGFSQNSNIVDFDFIEQANTNVYLKFEHPLPLIPNARVRLGQLETQGRAQLTSSFTFAGTTYSTNGEVATVLPLSNNDATLYWELLDNDLLAFDVGLTAKNISGDFSLSDDDQNSLENLELWLPMAYAAVKVRVPFAGVYAYADANLITYSSSEIHDYEVGVGYDLIDNIVVDIAMTLGYRDVKVNIDDVDDISAQLNYSGLFAGLEIHF